MSLTKQQMREQRYLRESRQRKEMIRVVLTNSAHANLSTDTIRLLANAIHAAVVAPLEKALRGDHDE